MPGASAHGCPTHLSVPLGPCRSWGCFGARRDPHSHSGAAAVPGLVALGASDGGPQLGVGAPQHVLLAGLVAQRPAGLQGRPVQPRPALLAALQAPVQRGQRGLRLVQLCPQPLSLGRSVQLGATAGRVGSGARDQASRGYGSRDGHGQRVASGSGLAVPPSPCPGSLRADSLAVPPRGFPSTAAQGEGQPRSPGRWHPDFSWPRSCPVLSA